MRNISLVFIANPKSNLFIIALIDKLSDKRALIFMTPYFGMTIICLVLFLD